LKTKTRKSEKNKAAEGDKEQKMPFRIQGRAVPNHPEGWTFVLKIFVNTDVAEGENLHIDGDAYATKDQAKTALKNAAKLCIEALEKKFNTKALIKEGGEGLN